MPSGVNSYFTLNTDRDKEIVDMYLKQRITGRKIALSLKESNSTIYKVLERNGVQRLLAYSVINGKKVCSKCNIEKEIEKFGTNKNRIKSWCKECRKQEVCYPETMKKWKEANRDKLLLSWRRKTERRKADPVQYLHSKIRISIHDCIAAKRHKKNRTFEILGYTPYDLKDHLESMFTDGMNWHNKGKWHVDHIRPLASFEFNSEEDIKLAWALKNLQPLWASDNIKKGSYYESRKHSYIK